MDSRICRRLRGQTTRILRGPPLSLMSGIASARRLAALRNFDSGWVSDRTSVWPHFQPPFFAFPDRTCLRVELVSFDISAFHLILGFARPLVGTFTGHVLSRRRCLGAVTLATGLLIRPVTGIKQCNPTIRRCPADGLATWRDGHSLRQVGVIETGVDT